MADDTEDDAAPALNNAGSVQDLINAQPGWKKEIVSPRLQIPQPIYPAKAPMFPASNPQKFYEQFDDSGNNTPSIPVSPFSVLEASTSTSESPKVYVSSNSQILITLSHGDGTVSITGLNTAIAVSEGDYITITGSVSGTPPVCTGASVDASTLEPAIEGSGDPFVQTGFNQNIAKIVAASDSAPGINIAGGLKIAQLIACNFAMMNFGINSSETGNITGSSLYPMPIGGI